MIDQTTLLTYLAILLGFVFLPGPATFLTLARASSSGTRVGVATALGIALGDVVHTAMTVFGLSAIIMASAYAFNVIKFLGAAYLVYLGIKAFMEKTSDTLVLDSRQFQSGHAFKQAIWIEVLNPKSAMFFLAFLPQFVNPANGSISLQLTTLGVIFILMGLVSTLTVAVGAGWVGRFLSRNQSIAKWQGKAVGSIYMALGAKLALQEK